MTQYRAAVPVSEIAVEYTPRLMTDPPTPFREIAPGVLRPPYDTPIPFRYLDDGEVFAGQPEVVGPGTLWPLGLTPYEMHYLLWRVSGIEIDVSYGGSIGVVSSPDFSELRRHYPVSFNGAPPGDPANPHKVVSNSAPGTFYFPALDLQGETAWSQEDAERWRTGTPLPEPSTKRVKHTRLRPDSKVRPDLLASDMSPKFQESRLIASNVPYRTYLDPSEAWRQTFSDGARAFRQLSSQDVGDTDVASANLVFVASVPETTVIGSRARWHGGKFWIEPPVGFNMSIRRLNRGTTDIPNVSFDYNTGYFGRELAPPEKSVTVELELWLGHVISAIIPTDYLETVNYVAGSAVSFTEYPTIKVRAAKYFSMRGRYDEDTGALVVTP